ncbi:MAG: sugar transferase [Pseudomonadota bacterium]
MTLQVTDISDAASAPVRHHQDTSDRVAAQPYRNGMKRALDLTLTLVSAVVWLPVVAILALAAASDGRSPFYTQRRVGRDGRIFRIVKLRTMVPNADERLEEYLRENPEAKAEWDATQKLKHDPRITTVGHILRVTSMDELPQLFNVVAGDMSLVGPRPFMENQKSMYPGLGYYRVRPGITGLWQVSDRNDSAFAYRAVLDDEYERTLSFANDVRILKRTVGAVVSCTGY